MSDSSPGSWARRTCSTDRPRSAFAPAHAWSGGYRRIGSNSDPTRGWQPLTPVSNVRAVAPTASASRAPRLTQRSRRREEAQSMATPFLSSEEYDERAHRLYNAGDYDRALEMLKEGLVLYPHCADLHVGLGYTRLAREEFAWARQSFETAIALEPDHEDALVGLGEVLLRLGRREEALELFERVRRGAGADDLDLLLSMGRALYRAGLFEDACSVFVEATELHPDSADAHAALGYTLHRLGRMGAARRELRRALRLDPHLHEARIYLGHLLYEKGEFEAALRQFERVPTSEHWDPM